MIQRIRTKYYSLHDIPAEDMLILPVPLEAFWEIEVELSKIFNSYPEIVSAYMVRVEYLNSSDCRLGVLIDACAPAHELANDLSINCRSVASCDLIFFEHISDAQIDRVTKTVKPFFNNDGRKNRKYLYKLIQLIRYFK